MCVCMGFFLLFSSSRLTLKLSHFMAWRCQPNPTELTKAFLPFFPSLLPFFPSLLPSFLSTFLPLLSYYGSGILYVLSYIWLKQTFGLCILEQACRPRILSHSVVAKDRRFLSIRLFFQIQYMFTHSVGYLWDHVTL